MTRRNVIALSVLASVFAGAVCVYSLRWPLVNALIAREFREVQPITTAELAAWLADASRPAPLLVDTRTRAEYEVSHLPGAKYGGSDADFDLAGEPRDRPIVAYCSIGYRSARFARTLQAAGFTNVRNLEGSIFKWANEGRPVFRGDARVAEVHPYNSTWAMFLDGKYRARVAVR
ncbi:MAG TPA: rhodanese-like domain-containing protein [Chthoniobacterales bacterium]|jgi:rhodanese-related sulfurtransferase